MTPEESLDDIIREAGRIEAERLLADAIIVERAVAVLKRRTRLSFVVDPSYHAGVRKAELLARQWRKEAESWTRDGS
jgi:hypothetical protein